MAGARVRGVLRGAWHYAPGCAGAAYHANWVPFLAELVISQNVSALQSTIRSRGPRPPRIMLPDKALVVSVPQTLPCFSTLRRARLTPPFTMNSSDPRLALRPQLDLAPASSPNERFQNDTLRPVLKLQHDHLVAIFRLFLTKRKVRLEQLPAARRFAKVKELVSRDNRLRGLLFGVALGQFTTSEMGYYLEHDGEVNRRLTNLLTERLTDAVG